MEHGSPVGKGQTQLPWVRVPAPLIIGRGSPQEHDHQQEDGKEESPESIVDPEFPPVLKEKTGKVTVQETQHSP